MSKVEAVARAICKEMGYDPDSKEPGDLPKCDGRGYDSDRPGAYREPWHWRWRDFTRFARVAIKAMKDSP